MAREVLQDGETFGIIRGKINANFLELYTDQLTPNDVLIKTNNTPFTPTNPYNPATKLYADSLITNWQSVYDPNNISLNVYVRANHIGQMQAQYIDQTSDYRFVSDSEKTLWNGKEPAIGAKNTAFNKNFGTITGTVSEGDHLHSNTYEPKNVNIQNHIATITGNPHAVTKTEVGLGNADNTSDVDKPISTATQSALDLKRDSTDVDFDYLDINNAAADPSHLEGRIFYDNNHDALSYYNSVSDMTLNLGQELVGRVFNNTGATIPNGAAVRYGGGSDPTTFQPYVVLAQADTFENARVVGLATHDIPNGTVGFITGLGVVHGLNTTTLTQGLLYLSETVAGGFTQTEPTIITIIGSVLRIDASLGAIFCKPDVNISLPNTFGELEGKVGTLTPSATYQDIAGYTNSDDIADTADITTGYITASKTSKYEFTVSMSLSFADSGASTEQIQLQLWDETNDTQVGISNLTIPRNSTSASRSFSKLFSGTEGHDYVLRLKSDTGFTNTLTFDDISFYAISL